MIWSLFFKRIVLEFIRATGCLNPVLGTIIPGELALADFSQRSDELEISEKKWAGGCVLMLSDFYGTDLTALDWEV